MQDLARKTVEAVDFRHVRMCDDPGCQYDEPCLPILLAGRNAPTIGCTPKLLHSLSEFNGNPVMIHIAFQVLDQLVPRRVFREGLGHRQPGQGRMAFVRMQVQSVIVLAPGRRHMVGPLQNHGGNSAVAECGGAGKTCGTGPDNKDVSFRHNTPGFEEQSPVNSRGKRR